MNGENAWTIFKNTGSVEAYLAYARLKSIKDNDAIDQKTERNNP